VKVNVPAVPKPTPRLPGQAHVPNSSRDLCTVTMGSMSQYDQIVVEADDGQVLYALINGNLGWLMYLRESGDAGFSSRNPNYDGPTDAVLDYRLSNGQVDEYPLSWALPAQEIQRALDYFRREQKPPMFITWHNDSGDGAAPDSRWTDSERKGRAGTPRPHNRGE
jgi:hypothetical protein